MPLYQSGRTGRILAGTAGFLLAASLHLPADAATISVPGTSPTIKGAMIQARAGDIILVSCGTYRESDIQVKPGVSLWSGTLQADCVTIDAGRAGRCLVFTGVDSTTSIVGFTLTGGRVAGPDREGWGGAVFCEDSSPRFTRCIMRGNSATVGGALAAVGSGGPRLEQCGLIDNEAAVHGGAVYWQAERGQLSGCTLLGNQAAVSGGAIAGDGGSLALSTCLLKLNSAGNSGGAMSLAGTAARLTGSVFAANTGGLAGGALSFRDTSPFMLQCTLHANAADGDGSVFHLSNANPVLAACLITGSDGRLLEAVGSRPTITHTNIFAETGGGWPGLLSGLQDGPGNLATDPLYCDPAVDDLHLGSDSPCLQDSGAGRIGALGQGCGAPFPPDVLESR